MTAESRDAGSRQRTGRPATSLYDLLGALSAGLTVVLFCLLLLRADPEFFWFDDYQISILPVFADMARSCQEGHWPSLSPYSWVCSNLAGEFQYGTFSIFVNAAVIAIWSFALDFPQQAAALSIIHLFALAMGAYMLARGRDLSPPLALMVALVSALNGWIISWGASDWFGALAAFTWLPWSWWAMERALRPGSSWRTALLPAPFIYLLITGGFPYTVLMLALVTAWLTVRALVGRRDWTSPVRLGVGWLLGLGLSAPAWIALLEYSHGSRRAVEALASNQWMVPLSGLPGLILPSWAVIWSTFEGAPERHVAVELACGLAAIIILMVALAQNGRAVLTTLRWDFVLLCAVLVICMLPSAGMFRFSFRSLPLFHVILALVAAEAFQIWSAGRGSAGRAANPAKWALVAVVLTGTIATAFGLTKWPAAPPLVVLLVLIAALWWFAHAALPRSGSAQPWLVPLVTFMSLFATYLAVPAHSAVSLFGFDADLNQPYPLERDRLYLSLYRSPPQHYKVTQTNRWFGTVLRPGSTSMFAGVHLINGYSPFGPAGITRLLDFGTHGHINPPRVREIVLPEAGPGGLLEQLGIDGIIVAWDFEMPAPLPANWESVYSSWEGEVFHREVPLPHVRALPDDQFSGAGVRIIENTRHRVIAEITPAEADKPTRLIFSRPYFPGYQAKLNGTALPVSSLQGLAPVVAIPPGQSGRVELVYRPRSATLGGAIAGVTLLVIATMALVLRRT